VIGAGGVHASEERDVTTAIPILLSIQKIQTMIDVVLQAGAEACTVCIDSPAKTSEGKVEGVVPNINGRSTRAFAA